MSKNFDIATLPNISQYISAEARDQANHLKENYKTIKQDALNILCFSINNKLSKPMILYNLLFFVEISFKYYLINSSNLNIDKIENHKHKIFELINSIKKVDNNINFDKLMYLLKKFKDKDGKSLDFSRYYNYKYNREIGNIALIMDLEMKQPDIEIVKEVIEWLNLHM